MSLAAALVVKVVWIVNMTGRLYVCDRREPIWRRIRWRAAGPWTADRPL